MDLTDEDGTRHRLWAIPADGDATEAVAPLLAAASRGPVTIADGHHRYETALRYRDERRMTRSCEEDPAFDYVLMLLLDGVGEPLTVLPTHRIVARSRRDRGGEPADGSRHALLGPERRLRRGAAPDIRAARAGARRRGSVRSLDAGRRGAAERRREAFEPYLPSGGAALRGLDVTLLGVALERLAGIDSDAVAAGAVGYTHSADEAIDRVDAGLDGADAAFLLTRPRGIGLGCRP